ncbi:MAG: hypothetical protein OXI03_01500 [Chloroflexota bacterium]|nr:hypothetical protein [Chloroflexota bacterium]
MTTTDVDEAAMDADSIAAAGEEIYNRKYREEYERLYRDMYVAINILDESITRSDVAVEAMLEAKREDPDGMFYLIWVGHQSAYRMSTVA